MKLVVGFITYQESTAKYLPYFLSSLKNQTFYDFKILAIDNSSQNYKNNIKYIKNNYPEIEIKKYEKNLGFGKAYNLMISRAIKLGAKYFLIINPDTILDTNAIKNLVKTLDINKNLAAVSPKVLSWNFANKQKTNIIDTGGIKLCSGMKFFDLGQGKIDHNQIDNAEILGPSGAVGLYRIKALEKIKQGREYFDEIFFMYKEDCDLAYRLFLSGFKSKCVGQAMVWHDRTVTAKGKNIFSIVLNRKNKSRQIKKWSFFGQQYIYIKYWPNQNWQNKISILWHEFISLVFACFFEPYLLKEFWEVIKIKKFKSKI